MSEKKYSKKQKDLYDRTNNIVSIFEKYLKEGIMSVFINNGQWFQYCLDDIDCYKNINEIKIFIYTTSFNETKKMLKEINKKYLLLFDKIEIKKGHINLNYYNKYDNIFIFLEFELSFGELMLNHKELNQSFISNVKEYLEKNKMNYTG